MSDNTSIEWTDATWNPIRARNLKTGRVGWHCEHATTGCENCYAEGMNKRLGTGLPFKPGHRKDVELFLDEKMLLQPLRWKKPRMIFVCSMTDLFADFVSDDWIDKMFAVMALCPQHTFQVLTKRAARMREYITHQAVERVYAEACREDGTLADRWIWPLPNVWLGVSAERQQEADERIPLLLGTPAATRFISAEPLLGALDIHLWMLTYPAIDWVIVGGESGPNARPMHHDWARGLRDQCAAVGVAFFFKQWGEWKDGSDFANDAKCVTTDGRIIEPVPDALVVADRDIPIAKLNPTMMRRVGKKAAGRLLDGIKYNAMPEMRR